MYVVVVVVVIYSSNSILDFIELNCIWFFIIIVTVVVGGGYFLWATYTEGKTSMVTLTIRLEREIEKEKV